jgi:hypothetical protein
MQLKVLSDQFTYRRSALEGSSDDLQTFGVLDKRPGPRQDDRVHPAATDLERKKTCPAAFQFQLVI